jgi:hypothetical protein
MYWWAGGQLSARIAAIRAAGDPASIADLAPEPAPAEENAAAEFAALDDDLDAFSRDYEQFFKTAVGKRYEQARDRGHLATSKQLAAMRAILDKYPALAAGLSRAAACPRYASLADFKVDAPKFTDQSIERIQQFRTAGRFQAWQIETLVGAGQSAPAVERGLEQLKLARLWENEPTLVCYLVGIAVRDGAADRIYDALAAGKVAPELHAELDAELARVDAAGRFAHMLRTERAYGVSSMVSQTRGNSPLGARIAAMMLMRSNLGVLDYYGKLMPVAEKNWHDNAAERKSGGLLAGPTTYGRFVDLLVPAVRGAYQAHQRDVALQRCLRIYNALREFAEANGREATGLNDLKLPAAATLDPFTGQPLLLKLTPEGWLVYTAYQDGADDGGDLKQQKDWGVGPRAQRAP